MKKFVWIVVWLAVLIGLGSITYAADCLDVRFDNGDRLCLTLEKNWNRYTSKVHSSSPSSLSNGLVCELLLPNQELKLLGACNGSFSYNSSSTGILKVYMKYNNTYNIYNTTISANYNFNDGSRGSISDHKTTTQYSAWGMVTVQYDSNGGVWAPSSHTVPKDSSGVANYKLSTQKPEMTRNGNCYDFLGWRLDNSTAYDIDNPWQNIAIQLTHGKDETLTYYAQRRNNGTCNNTTTISVNASANRINWTTDDRYSYTATTNVAASKITYSFNNHSTLYTLYDNGSHNFNAGSASVSSDKKTWIWNNDKLWAGNRVITIIAYDANGQTAATTLNINVTSGPISTNGVCGKANNTEKSSIPTIDLCSAGTASSVVRENWMWVWTWNCIWSNGGTTASCRTLSKDAVLIGTCWSANGSIVSSKPTTNLCSAGTASSVSWNWPWTWDCMWSHMRQSCTANVNNVSKTFTKTHTVMSGLGGYAKDSFVREVKNWKIVSSSASQSSRPFAIVYSVGNKGITATTKTDTYHEYKSVYKMNELTSKFISGITGIIGYFTDEGTSGVGSAVLDGISSRSEKKLESETVVTYRLNVDGTYKSTILKFLE